MTEQPPPIIDYQPPQEGRQSPFLMFFLGVLAGGAFALATTFVGILFLVANYMHQVPPFWANALVFVGSVLTIAGGCVLAINPRPRPFGLGVASSVPIVAAGAFVVCGGLR